MLRNLFKYKVIRHHVSAANKKSTNQNTDLIPRITTPRLHGKFHDWLIFSDLHVRSQSIDVCIDVLRNIHKIAVETNHGVIFLGDFWHVRGSLNIELINTILMEFKRWSRDIPIVMIPGNHDQVHIGGTTHSLEVLKYAFADDQVLIINQPSICMGALWIPYRKDMHYVRYLIESLIAKPSNSDINMVFCHAELKGIRKDIWDHHENVDSNETNRVSANENDLNRRYIKASIPELGEPLGYESQHMNDLQKKDTHRAIRRQHYNDVVVYSGHYHKPYVLVSHLDIQPIDNANIKRHRHVQKELNIRYVGSPYQISLSESNQLKYLYTLSRYEEYFSHAYPVLWKEGKELRFDIPSAKKHYQYKIELPLSSVQQLAQLKSDFNTLLSVVKKMDRLVLHILDGDAVQSGNQSTTFKSETNGWEEIMHFITNLENMGVEVVTKRKAIEHINTKTRDDSAYRDTTSTASSGQAPVDIFLRYLETMYRAHPLIDDLRNMGIEWLMKYEGDAKKQTHTNFADVSNQGYYALQLDSVSLCNFGPFGGHTRREKSNVHPVSYVSIDVNNEVLVDWERVDGSKGQVLMEEVDSSDMLHYPLSNRGLVLIRGKVGRPPSQIASETETAYVTDSLNCGGNGVGKTSLLMSVMWGLSGTLDTKIAQASDIRINDVISDAFPSSVAEVRVKGLINQLPFEVVRKRSKKKTYLSFMVNGEDLSCLSVKDTQILIDNTLGIGNNLLSRCAFFGQHSHAVDSLLGSSDVRFKEELLPVLESFKIEQWASISSHLRSEVKECREKRRELELSNRLYGDELHRLEEQYQKQQRLFEQGLEVSVRACVNQEGDGVCGFGESASNVQESYQHRDIEKQSLISNLKTCRKELRCLFEEKQDLTDTFNRDFRALETIMNTTLHEKTLLESEFEMKTKDYRTLMQALMHDIEKGSSKEKDDPSTKMDDKSLLLHQFIKFIQNAVALNELHTSLVDMQESGMLPEALVSQGEMNLQICMPKLPAYLYGDRKRWEKDWGKFFGEYLHNSHNKINQTFKEFQLDLYEKMKLDTSDEFLDIEYPGIDAGQKDWLESILQYQAQLNIESKNIESAMHHIETHMIVEEGRNKSKTREITSESQCPTCGQVLNDTSLSHRMMELSEARTRSESQRQLIQSYYTLWAKYCNTLQASRLQMKELFDCVVAYLNHQVLLQNTYQRGDILNKQLHDLRTQLEAHKRQYDVLVEASSAKERDLNVTISQYEDQLENISKREGEWMLQMKLDMERHTQEQLQKDRTRLLEDVQSNKTIEYELNKNRLRQIIATNQNEIQENLHTEKLLEELSAIFGIRGIQHYLYCSVIKELECLTNDYLDTLSNGTMKIQFDTLDGDSSSNTIDSQSVRQGPMSSNSMDKIKKSVFIKSTPSSPYWNSLGNDADLVDKKLASCHVKQRSVSQLSGGQWKRVSLALDLAYAGLLKREGRLSVNMIVLDELFSFLDASGYEAVSEVLNNMIKRNTSNNIGNGFETNLEQMNGSVPHKTDYEMRPTFDTHDSIFVILQNHHSDRFEEVFDSVDIVYRE